MFKKNLYSYSRLILFNKIKLSPEIFKYTVNLKEGKTPQKHPKGLFVFIFD